MTIKARDILEGAKTILQTTGWCKGIFRDHDGRCCIVGAMDRAAWMQKIRCVSPQYYCADKALRSLVPNGNLPAFNDDQTSVEPVLELIDRAIASLE